MRKSSGDDMLLGFALWAGCGRERRRRHAGRGHGADDGRGRSKEGGGGVEMCGEHACPRRSAASAIPTRSPGWLPGEGLRCGCPPVDSAELAGRATGRGYRSSGSGSDRCFAELTFNQNKLARRSPCRSAASSRASRPISARSGTDRDVLARIWSAQIAEAVAKAVLSHQTLERERQLRADGIAPAKDLQEAEAAHRAACQQARTLGFSEDDDRTHEPRPRGAGLPRSARAVRRRDRRARRRARGAGRDRHGAVHARGPLRRCGRC